MDASRLRALAESSLPAVDELYNSITSISHIEEPYLRKSLELRSIHEIDLPPVQRKVEDLTTKRLAR